MRYCADAITKKPPVTGAVMGFSNQLTPILGLAIFERIETRREFYTADAACEPPLSSETPTRPLAPQMGREFFVPIWRLVVVLDQGGFFRQRAMVRPTSEKMSEGQTEGKG